MAAILALPVVLLAAAFVIVPSDWLAARSNNSYLMNLGYGAKLSQQRCDVVLYGDSGAMIGADPAIIQRRTGLSVCNVAEFEGMTLVNHTLPLDIFLSRNPRPRFLIFLYAPPNFSVPFSWANAATFEAINFRLRYKPDLGFAGMMALHPLQSMGWAEEGLRLALTRLFSAPLPPQASRLREESHGRLRVATARTLTACDPRIYRYLPDPRWIEHLRSAYSTGGTTVLVDAIPTADCDPNIAWDDQHLRGIIDDYPLTHFPISAYTGEGLEHTNDLGSSLLSNLLADQITARLPRQSKAPPPPSPR